MNCKLCEMDISDKPYYTFKAGSLIHQRSDHCRDALLDHVKILEKTIREMDKACTNFVGLIDVMARKIAEKETQFVDPQKEQFVLPQIEGRARSRVKG